MRYKESREQSAELLRMVLPLMARHAAGFHPLSYSIWYEYAAGTNPGLKAAIDARLAQSAVIDDREIERLFDTYVAMRDIDSSARMRAEIARMIEHVDGVTDEAGQDVQRYGNELDGYRERLQTSSEPQAVGQLVDSLIDDTSRLRIKTGIYREDLKKSSEEVERLRGELELVQGLALSDPLTGLLNRRGFDQQTARVCRGSLSGCTLLLLDIDHFKAINDAHGHLLGDKVIVAVANVLRACVGERGPIARIGGEEFAVLLSQTSSAGGAELAERIRAAVERGKIRRADNEDSIGTVTVSLGLATCGDHEQFEALSARTDRALYQSKAAGRNRVSVAERAPGTAD
ncbi:MAG TPA: GGDEF domain-containing protein [Steroidobacteraceae bacterium]|jgi:diguanylate cyclase